MADLAIATITVDAWGPEGPPRKGDLIAVSRTGEMMEVLDVSEDGLTLTVARVTDSGTQS